MLIGVAAVFLLAVTPASARAQFNLWVMYDTGEGVLQDDAEAVRWYQSDTAASLHPADATTQGRSSSDRGL